MKIVCIGDSLTYGYGVRHQDAWISLAGKKAAEHEILNLGIPGDTTAGMLARFEKDVLNKHPDQVFLMGGTNDIFFEKNIVGAKSNIATMISVCMVRKIKVILGIPLPICKEALTDDWRPYAEASETTKLLEELTEWLKNYGQQFAIPILSMEDALPKEALRKSACYLDGVHLNEEGNDRMADLFLSFIQ